MGARCQRPRVLTFTGDLSLVTRWLFKVNPVWEGVGEQEEEEEGDFRSGAVHAAQSARPHKVSRCTLSPGTDYHCTVTNFFFLPKTIF